MTKRLEKWTFAWPQVDAGTRSVTRRAEDLSMLLGGLHVKVKRYPFRG